MNSYRRTGKKWSIPEILRLHREYELLELDIQNIAYIHNRTINAICFKLVNSTELSFAPTLTFAILAPDILKNILGGLLGLISNVYLPIKFFDVYCVFNCSVVAVKSPHVIISLGSVKTVGLFGAPTGIVLLTTIDENLITNPTGVGLYDKPIGFTCKDDELLIPFEALLNIIYLPFLSCAMSLLRGYNLESVTCEFEA